MQGSIHEMISRQNKSPSGSRVTTKELDVVSPALVASVVVLVSTVRVLV